MVEDTTPGPNCIHAVFIQNCTFSIRTWTSLQLAWRRPNWRCRSWSSYRKLCACGWVEGMGVEAFQPGSQQECSPHLSREPRWDRIIKRNDRSQREEREAPTSTHALAEEEEEEEKCFDAALGEGPVWEQSSGIKTELKEGWRWKGRPADQSLEHTWWRATATVHKIHNTDIHTFVLLEKMKNTVTTVFLKKSLLHSVVIYINVYK